MYYLREIRRESEPPSCVIYNPLKTSIREYSTLTTHKWADTGAEQHVFVFGNITAVRQLGVSDSISASFRPAWTTQHNPSFSIQQ